MRTLVLLWCVAAAAAVDRQALRGRGRPQPFRPQPSPAVLHAATGGAQSIDQVEEEPILFQQALPPVYLPNAGAGGQGAAVQQGSAATPGAQHQPAPPSLIQHVVPAQQQLSPSFPTKQGPHAQFKRPGGARPPQGIRVGGGIQFAGAPDQSRPRDFDDATLYGSYSPHAFAYAVSDEYYGTQNSHTEQSDGEKTQGEYRVLLPDGRMQIVTYSADANSGFQAQVSYEGEARPYVPPDPKKGHGGPAFRDTGIPAHLQ